MDGETAGVSPIRACIRVALLWYASIYRFRFEWSARSPRLPVYVRYSHFTLRYHPVNTRHHIHSVPLHWYTYNRGPTKKRSTRYTRVPCQVYHPKLCPP